VTARISSTSDAAAASSPEIAWSQLRASRASGSALSAPAVRACSNPRVERTVQLSSSQRSAALQQASKSQRASWGGRTVSHRKALTACFKTGAPAEYPPVTRSASPWRSRSDGRGGCGGGGPASAAWLTSIGPLPWASESARRGYVDGRALEHIFAWLRPNDLVWNYFVNNYLLGKDPPAFDILYWNQDTVRLAAGLHRDFIRFGLENALTHPGEADVLGTPIDLGAITLDTYAVAGLNDHIVTWENAYRSVELLGGSTRFVLSTSGHIQALVNPPGPNSHASFRVADAPAGEPDRWAEAAAVKGGSWWPDYGDWLTQRAGDLKPAPKTLGNRKFKPMAKAPGSYVHAS
jgi:hypothetical protein